MTALQQARAKGEAGIQSSAQHAEEDVPGWGDTAQMVLRWFLRRHDQPFTIEQVRLWSELHDLPRPPDDRAFGAVTRRAIKNGLIKPTGLYRSTASSNGSKKPLYVRA